MEETIDNSCHVKVAMELMWKDVPVLSFNNKNPCLSTFLLQFFKHAKNGVTNLNVNDRFRSINNDFAIFDSHISSCCCNNSIIEGCRSFAGLMFANGSNLCSGVTRLVVIISTRCTGSRRVSDVCYSDASAAPFSTPHMSFHQFFFSSR